MNIDTNNYTYYIGTDDDLYRVNNTLDRYADITGSQYFAWRWIDGPADLCGWRFVCDYKDENELYEKFIYFEELRLAKKEDLFIYIL